MDPLLHMNRTLLSFIVGCTFIVTCPSAAIAQASEIGEETSLFGETDEPQVQNLPTQALTPSILFSLLLGEIAGARGDFDIAVGVYLQLARQTHDPRIARRATEIAIFARNVPAATESARAWVSSDPGSEEAQKILASILASSGDRLDEVQFQLARILAESPEQLEQNLMSLNRALSALPDKNTVHSIITRLTQPYLAQPSAHFARAQAAMAAEDTDSAQMSIDKALEARPDWAPAVLLQSQLSIQMDEPDEALKSLQLYLLRNPDDYSVRHTYARILILQHHLKEALVEFQYLLNAQPDNPDLIYAVAVLSAQLGDVTTAVPLFERALQAGHPAANTIRLQLGQASEQNNQLEEALRWYRSVPSGSTYIEAQIRIATVLAKQNKLNEALLHLRGTEFDEQNGSRRIFVEVMVLRNTGHLKEAMALLDEALIRKPDDTSLLYESAMVAEQLKQLDVLELRLRRVIEINPKNAHAYNALGYTLADHGLRLAEAEKLISTALELSPDDPYIMDSLGWVRFRRGDIQSAASILQQAYSMKSDPEIAAHLGEVLWALGQHEEARQLWNKALLESPDNKTLRETMQRLSPS